MICKSVRVYAVLAVGAAILAAAGGPAVAATSAISIAQRARSLPPQQNIPDLDAPGSAQTVNYPPDGQLHNGSSAVSVQAPPYTRITRLELSCVGQSCPVSIAGDGRSAAGQLTARLWNFIHPFYVDVVAEANAPLAGGTFSGTFTLDGVTQPLTVNIKPGIQGIVAANLRNTSPRGGGVRVVSVDPGSKAEASGLQPGDLIIDAAGTPIPTVNDLDTFLDGKRAGATYPVTVRRGGTTVLLQLILDPTP